MEPARHLRFVGGQDGHVVAGPPACPPADRVKQVWEFVETDLGDALAASSAAERYDDRTVVERAGKGPDLRDGLRAPGGESFGLALLALHADDECPATRVAAVEDPAQLGIVIQEGVGLVDQERR